MMLFYRVYWGTLFKAHGRVFERIFGAKYVLLPPLSHTLFFVYEVVSHYIKALYFSLSIKGAVIIKHSSITAYSSVYTK